MGEPHCWTAAEWPCDREMSNSHLPGLHFLTCKTRGGGELLQFIHIFNSIS